MFGLTPGDRDYNFTYKSRKRGAGNSLQFDRIVKSSKPSPVQLKKFHGTAYFKQRGYFEQVSIDIGTRNNSPKASSPTLTVFSVINLRQTQKDIEKDVMNYVDMKMLAQVNRIKNPSKKEIEEAKHKDLNSDFVYCTFLVYEGYKLHGITNQICMTTVLGNQGAVFFGNGFSINDEKKLLWSAHGRKKLPNPFSCTAPSFMKRPIKKHTYDYKKRYEIFCYTPQLCDRAEKANTHNNKPFISFTVVNEESFAKDFNPTDLIGTGLEKMLNATKAVQNIAKMMCEQKKALIIQNLKNVAKHLLGEYTENTLRIYCLRGKT